MGIEQTLKELRKQQHLTLVQLAQKSGVSAATISRLENGYLGIKLSNFEKIVGALGYEVKIKQDPWAREPNPIADLEAYDKEMREITGYEDKNPTLTKHLEKLEKRAKEALEWWKKADTDAVS
jgi:transcriptional regulator with XRE-family HTH domain